MEQRVADGPASHLKSLLQGGAVLEDRYGRGCGFLFTVTKLVSLSQVQRNG